MSEEKDEKSPRESEVGESKSPFPELEEIQRDVEKRLRDNRIFLERFLDEDFEEDEAEEDDGEDDFEEL